MTRISLPPPLRLACLAAALCCPACGKGRTEVHPVTGQVLVSGRPAQRAVVTFHPVEDSGPEKVRPTGHVDAQGRFKLSTFNQGDGAPAGEYRVTVVWYLATRPRHAPREDPVPVNHLPRRYAQAETSQLRARIGKGVNELEPFRLQAN